MPAKSKSQLLTVTRKEFDKLAGLLATLDRDTAMKKRGDDTSIKDIVAHRAHWIGLFLGWYADGMAGRPVAFPAESYKWNDFKRYNADLRRRQAGLTWADALDLLETEYARLLDFIEARSETELYDGPMKGAKNDWTPGRWAEAAGPSHFRSASKYVRAALRAGA